MWFNKIQNEILRDAYKRDACIGKQNFAWKHGKYGNMMAFINSDSVYLIPKERIYINIDNIFGTELDISKLLAGESNAEMLIITNNILTTDRFALRKLRGITEDVYIDVKKLQPFLDEDKGGLQFRGTNKRSLVYVYGANGSKLLGATLPVPYYDEGGRN